MSHNKKRVSFSHLKIEPPLKLANLVVSDYDGERNPNASSSPSSSVSSDSSRVPPVLKPTLSPKSSYNLAVEQPNDGYLTPDREKYECFSPAVANLGEFKFNETRRRSHAFSVSALDDTLTVSYNGSVAGDDCGDGDDRSERDENDDSGNQSNSFNKRHSEKKLFRHAEIPITAVKQVLICQTSNQIIQEKSFYKELRAIRDVEIFLENPNILLDIGGNNVGDVIYQMLEIFKQSLHPNVLDEIHSTLYAQDSTFQFSNTVQSIYLTNDNQYIYNPTWFCAFASIAKLQTRRVVIARLRNPINFGPTLQTCRFVVLVLVPSKEKPTKSGSEIARTFATLFSDSSLLMALLSAQNEKRFCETLEERVKNLKSLNFILGKREESGQTPSLSIEDQQSGLFAQEKQKFQFSFGKGLMENFSRRLKYYPSDFIDGLTGPKTLLKVSSSTLSLFFACILPCVAFGVLNSTNTDNLIGPKEALIGQAIGGLLFALFSGQPLVIIATTAPLCLYTAVVYQISLNLGVQFYDLFAAVGIWNAFFLVLYSVFDLSQLMHLCTRSTEEIFATFIFFAFTIDAFKQCIESFETFYCFDTVTNQSALNSTVLESFTNLAHRVSHLSTSSPSLCSPDKSILFLFLMLATVALALLLYNFSSTPYLSSLLREILADYALPLAVIVFSLIGSFAFQDVGVEHFEIGTDYRWNFATLSSLNVQSVFMSLVLGFALSLLFFIDQNVSAALVSCPANNLKKGDAYHWDLMVVAVLNLALSLMGLPWMHGILPHSPIHAHSLADMVPAGADSGRSWVVVRIRETRITGILIHILIGLVVVLIPQAVGFIPIAVLSGLFLYCAISTLQDNTLYQRTLLLLTEQTSYPPAHYLRYCPQKIVHLFTGSQLLQLALICFFGFAPWEYLQLVFPLVIALLIPVRWSLLPLFLEERYLSIIDNKHY